MALIRFGNGVADIRGSINGTTFSRVRGGAIARNRTVPINPNTPSQIASRTAFALVVATWQSLSDADRQTWNEYAATLLFINRLGETFVPTGRMVYMRLNGRLGFHVNPLAVLTLPPIAADVPLQPVVTDLEFDLASGTWSTLNLQVAAPPTGVHHIVQATQVLNGQTKVAQNEWRFIKPGTIAIGVMDLVAEYTSVFGTATVANKFLMGLRIASLDWQSGLVSPWVEFQFPSEGTVAGGSLTATGTVTPIGA